MIAALAFSLALAGAAPAQEIGADFSLPATDGRRLDPEALRGKPYLLFFGFTHCPEICPMALSEIALRLDELGLEGDRLTPIFVTVDPARDTLAHLRDYLGWFDPRLIGLSGSAAETEAIARSFRATYRKVPTEGGDYTMDHSAAIYLIDGAGEFFGHIDYRDPPESQLAALRALLAAEKDNHHD
ncbi:electron transport protein SCO1/SenC [Paracoccus aminophilus JCM 7686]|uniref:Electron transport protein SCO1/SenC n=1 Tax=Paracoccus aminophilus JCM 7686 TaxID=1367847 RepID=S5YT56_PARAH|nr:electron transport protein SCO1/SenC [Paracoccus aminophilus JCM 7686]